MICRLGAVALKCGTAFNYDHDGKELMSGFNPHFSVVLYLTLERLHLSKLYLTSLGKYLVSVDKARR